MSYYHRLTGCLAHFSVFKSYLHVNTVINQNTLLLLLSDISLHLWVKIILKKQKQIGKHSMPVRVYYQYTRKCEMERNFGKQRGKKKTNCYLGADEREIFLFPHIYG